MQLASTNRLMFAFLIFTITTSTSLAEKLIAWKLCQEYLLSYWNNF